MAVQGVTTLNAVGVGSPILINLNQFHFGVGLLCTLTLGNASAVNYGCQVSGDNPNAGPGSFTHWNAHDVLTNLTASANDSLRYPCSAMRLIVNSVTTPGGVAWTGNVALAVVQTNSM
jgi:hypothetical protein